MKNLFENLAVQQMPTGPGLGIVFLAWIILGLLCFFNCALNKRISNTSRGVWLLVIFFIPLLGSIAYLIGGRIETKETEV
jgi:uncharacterized membrane protein YhaH (DUF805 family)